jgi:hypothetical protein
LCLLNSEGLIMQGGEEGQPLLALHPANPKNDDYSPVTFLVEAIRQADLVVDQLSTYQSSPAELQGDNYPQDRSLINATINRSSRKTASVGETR